MSRRIEILLPLVVAATIVVAIATYRWLGEGADGEDDRRISDLQLTPGSPVEEELPPGYCTANEECDFDGRCRFGRCRRPLASLKMMERCGYSDECPVGTTCRESHCRPMRRVRTRPGYQPTGSDWAQFRGPQRTAVSPETGLLRSWPAGGPPLLWSAGMLGMGYGHPAIANGKVYLAGMYGTEGRITALDLDGRALWQRPYGPEWRQGFGRGARQTPTVEGGRLFLASSHGLLFALDAESGSELWQQELFGDNKAEIPRDGFADAPLVHDDKIILLVGSSSRLAVAYSAVTGELVWETPGSSPQNAYGALVPVQMGDRQLVAGMVQEGLVLIDADTGELLWLDGIPELVDPLWGDGPRRTFASPPVFQNGELFRAMIDFEQGTRIGSRLVRLDPTTLQRETAWNQPHFGVHYGGAAFWQGTLYGISSFDQRPRESDQEDPEIALMAVDWATGRIVGQTTFQGIDKAPLIIADGLLIAYCEKGTVALLEVDGGTMNLTGSFRISFGVGHHISYPALSDGVLYIRHHDTMAAYDVRRAPHP